MRPEPRGQGGPRASSEPRQPGASLRGWGPARASRPRPLGLGLAWDPQAGPPFPDRAEGRQGARLQRRLRGGALRRGATASAGRDGHGAGGPQAQGGRWRTAPPPGPTSLSPEPGFVSDPSSGAAPGALRPLLPADFSAGRPPSSTSSSSSSSGRRVTGRRRSGGGGAVREDGARCEVQGRGALGPGAALPGSGERRVAFPGPGGQAALETQPPGSGTPAPTLMGLGGSHELVKGVHHAWASRAVRHGPFHPRDLGHVPEPRASVPSSLKGGVGLDGQAATGHQRVCTTAGGAGGAGTSPSCRLNPAQPLAPGAPPALALFHGLSSRYLPKRPL